MAAWQTRNALVLQRMHQQMAYTLFLPPTPEVLFQILQRAQRRHFGTKSPRPGSSHPSCNRKLGWHMCYITNRAGRETTATLLPQQTRCCKMIQCSMGLLWLEGCSTTYNSLSQMRVCTRQNTNRNIHI